MNVMRLGIDFDNTIVCYDALFYDEARDRRLIPADVPRTKTAVRDYLRQVGQEEAWTQLQGFVYGPGIGRAPAFQGLHECLARLRRRGVAVCIISHKTRVPVLGPRCDLHAAARQWLADQRLLPDPHSVHSAESGLGVERVFFEETKEAKLQRIVAEQCTHFVDDLPEFLAERDFPPGVTRILFDPHRCGPAAPRLDPPASSLLIASSWSEIADLLHR